MIVIKDILENIHSIINTALPDETIYQKVAPENAELPYTVWHVIGSLDDISSFTDEAIDGVIRITAWGDDCENRIDKLMFFLESRSPIFTLCRLGLDVGKGRHNINFCSVTYRVGSN